MGEDIKRPDEAIEDLDVPEDASEEVLGAGVKEKGLDGKFNSGPIGKE